MNNKIISKKKAIVYISVLLFTLFSLYSTYSMGNTAQNMYEHPYKVTNTSRAMRSRLIDMKRFVGIFLTSNQNENEINQLFEERYKMQNEAIDELYNLYLGSIDDIDSLKKAMNNLILSQNKAIQFSKTHTNEEILNYISEIVYPFYDVIDSKLDIIINSSDARIYNMAEKTQFTSHVFLGSSIFLILVIIILSIYIDKTRYQQFKELLDRETRLEHALNLVKSANDKKNNLEKKLKSENVQLECAKELYNNHEINIALINILGYVGNLFSADRAYILLFHNNSFEWCNEGISSQIDNLKNIQINEYQIWKKEIDTKSNLVIDDIEKIRDVYFDEYKMFLQRGVRNVVWVSFTKDEKIDGIIGLDNPDLNMLEIIVPFLQTIQYFISLSIQRQEDEKMLYELSQIDKLTSFYNRNRFTKDIEEFKKSNNSVGVIYLDINGLKETNDFYGHDAGDKLLKRYAKIIKNGASSNNLYRVGGDEFVILYSCIEEDTFYHNVRILKNNFEKNECHIALGAKWTENSHYIRDIIKSADESMYMDKKKYYQNHLVTTRYRHNNDLLNYLGESKVLKEKIKNKKFIVYLQPKININDHTLIGAEALVRYQDDNGFIITPDKFIPILENTLLISEIDYYVFEEVCKNLSIWNNEKNTKFTISSNFSKITFMDDNFVKRIKKISEKYGIKKCVLEIEITETAHFIDFNILINRINEIKSAGFKVSIDDFGIESSNLALLALIQFDTLKVDKEFIKDITVNQRSQMIIKLMADMCKKMDILLVAEGVENNQQLDVLKNYEIKIVQGFLFSKPITINEFEDKYLEH